MSDVIYLYGYVPAAATDPPPVLVGVEAAAVRLVRQGSIAAVVSALPGASYSASAVEARLEDLAWLGERGVAHERVVAWFVDHGDIVPAPLLTLYSGEGTLARALGERQAALAGELERLGGRREWDLKIACDRAELERNAGSISPELRALDDQIAAAPAGRRFLLERKRADLLKQDLGAAARNIAAGVLEVLRAAADEIVVLSPPRAAAELPVLLAAALLVRRERERELRELLLQQTAAFSRLGFSIDMTGPWAPYRFINAERLQPA